jgi:hypothetical protein
MDNEIEVMRVLRLPPLGKLVVEVNGHRFEKLAEIPNAGLKHRLMAAVGELIVFTDGYQSLVDAGVAPPLAVETKSHPGTTEQASPDLEARRAAFLASMERERDALVASANLPPSPTHVISAAGRDDSIALEKPTSIVGQIDNILQKHVRSEPKLEGRSIHLEQASSGGLRVNVDGKVYQRPAEIEDKEVQLAIKMALKEWEST